MKRYLVTTALESSWKRDKPLLFLGEWCRRRERRPVWLYLDAELAPAYGLFPCDKRHCVAQVEALAAQLLQELVPVLNRQHSQEHGLRYWQIILGHWLQRYVSVAWFRYFSVRKVLQEFDLAGTTMVVPAHYSLATNDSLEFIWATNDDLWNHAFYCRVIQALNKNDWEQQVIAVTGPSMFLSEERGRPRSSMLSTAAGFVFESMLPVLARRKDAFIVNSFLPAKQEALLQLALGQVPQRWRTPRLPLLPTPRHTKDRLAGWHPSGCQGFDLFVRELLPEVIPACFLEGYKAITTSANLQNWPSRPKFIFTSNNFDTDEVFKVWAAGKAEAGTPYLTGQHGNNYGTHYFYGNHAWPERAAADGFLTWGWNDGSLNTIPAFNFKTDPCSAVACDPQGGLLLVETCATHRIMPWDVDAEHLEYLDQQFRFVDALLPGIREKLVIRLHAGGNRLHHEEPARWADRYPGLAVDQGRKPVRALAAKSRLVVHSYDSTGILEMLAANQPCLCFWPGGLDHLDASALPHYDSLRTAGIIQDSPEAAAMKIGAIWDDVASWWLSDSTQAARKAFCERYSRTDVHPVRTMKNILLSCTKPPATRRV